MVSTKSNRKIKTTSRDAGILIVASDVGHQNVKIKSGLREDLVGNRSDLRPALITHKNRIEDYEDNYFHLKGGNTVWADRYWSNQGTDLDAFTPTSDMGKVDKLLPLFISAIWDNLVDGDLVYYVGSVHELSWASEMSRAVQGNHLVEFQGVTKHFTVEVIRIFVEGAGAVASHYISMGTPVSGKTTVLDIGSGTTILIPMDGLQVKANTAPYSIPGGGVRQFISNLCIENDIKRALNKDQAINYLDMQKAILTDRIVNSRFNSVDITPYLHSQINHWFTRSTQIFKVAMDEHLRHADLLLATGGGCLIPEVAELLRQEGWIIANEPLWANVDGLYLIAQKLVMKMLQQKVA